MILVETVIIALVAYRLWQFAANDTITEPIRARIEGNDWLWAWLSCPWCAGTWAAVGITIAAYSLGTIHGSPWLVAPAAACLVGLIGDRH